VGSFLITIGAEGTILCAFDSKKSKNCCLTSVDFIPISSIMLKLLIFAKD
jgi:hypothetical protein